MAGYSKNIAVIRAMKGGFSVDGGALSGLVKAEKYGGYMRAEVVKINFAPLSSGRYVTGISDGVRVELCSGDCFEGRTEIDISCGFAALVCFVREGEVSPVAKAVCGDYSWALSRIQAEIERCEGAPGDRRYDDDAIAEDNYYEYGDGAQDGGSVRKDSQQKEVPRRRKDEDDFGLRKGQKTYKAPIDLPRADGEEDSGESAYARHFSAQNSVRGKDYVISEAPSISDCHSGGLRADENSAPYTEEGDVGQGSAFAGDDASGEVAFHRLKNAQSTDKNNGLGDGGGKDFYARMRAEIERLLKDYPREEKLEQTVKGSRWVRINYGVGRHYVFGVIYEGLSPAYVCYGVPSKNSTCPPASLSGMASYIPAGRQGYWVMYQNAQTGESVRLRAE